MGRHDEAIAELTRALERDPLSLIIRTEFGRVYYHARRYDDAERVARSALDLDSSFADAHWVLASVAAEQPGEAEAAIAGFRRASSVLPSPFELAYAQVKAGNQRAARQILDSILARYARGDPNPRHAQVAEIYAALGLTDSAFAALERAYEAGIDDQLTYLKVRPPLDPLRDDPRFADLLRRMRFP
jgi:tetratricopeptide (TPR) repeat protein